MPGWSFVELRTPKVTDMQSTKAIFQPRLVLYNYYMYVVRTISLAAVDDCAVRGAGLAFEIRTAE